MVSKNTLLFLLSVIAAVAIWGWLVSIKFGLVIVAAITIHEYGHFYWMGREGIKNKVMLFIPPFGAVAAAKEFWPSRGAESRIALAGPAFGLLSVILFFCLYWLTGNKIFMASVYLACLINLFNLLTPITFLDGGRVIKSILFSINEKIGVSFYLCSLAAAIFLFISGYFQFFFGLLIMFLAFKDFDDFQKTRESLRLHFQKMNSREMIISLVFFVVLILSYLQTLQFVSSSFGIKLSEIIKYF